MVKHRSHTLGFIVSRLLLSFDVSVNRSGLICLALSEANLCGEKAPDFTFVTTLWPRPDIRLLPRSSFDCKGLFSPSEDSIYYIFVLILFCNAKS